MTIMAEEEMTIMIKEVTSDIYIYIETAKTRKKLESYRLRAFLQLKIMSPSIAEAGADEKRVDESLVRDNGNSKIIALTFLATTL
jgi:hypothetical protein